MTYYRVPHFGFVRRLISRPMIVVVVILGTVPFSVLLHLASTHSDVLPEAIEGFDGLLMMYALAAILLITAQLLAMRRVWIGKGESNPWVSIRFCELCNYSLFALLSIFFARYVGLLGALLGAVMADRLAYQVVVPVAFWRQIRNWTQSNLLTHVPLTWQAILLYPIKGLLLFGVVIVMAQMGHGTVSLGAIHNGFGSWSARDLVKPLDLLSIELLPFVGAFTTLATGAALVDTAVFEWTGRERQRPSDLERVVRVIVHASAMMFSSRYRR